MKTRSAVSSATYTNIRPADAGFLYHWHSRQRSSRGDYRKHIYYHAGALKRIYWHSYSELRGNGHSYSCKRPCDVQHSNVSDNQRFHCTNSDSYGEHHVSHVSL